MIKHLTANPQNLNNFKYTPLFQSHRSVECLQVLLIKTKKTSKCHINLQTAVLLQISLISYRLWEAPQLITAASLPHTQHIHHDFPANSLGKLDVPFDFWAPQYQDMIFYVTFVFFPVSHVQLIRVCCAIYNVVYVLLSLLNSTRYVPCSSISTPVPCF